MDFPKAFYGAFLIRQYCHLMMVVFLWVDGFMMGSFKYNKKSSTFEINIQNSNLKIINEKVEVKVSNKKIGKNK
jgi:hypothetical protein